MTKQQQYVPPAQIMSPYPVDQTEYDQAMIETQIERDWYANVKPYENDADIAEGVGSGDLVRIEANSNYLPIMRFRNPDLHDQYPPYLSVKAKVLLDDICYEWRNKMNEASKPANIRLALTSMVRTVEYQKELLEAQRFAQEDSPHTFGEAIDLDSAGYYIGEQPMNPRVEVKEVFEKSFQSLSTRLAPKELADMSLYDKEVTALLREILEKRMATGQIHFIVEFKGTHNEIFHICRNPHYHPTLPKA